MVWDWSAYLADYGQPTSKYLRVNPATALSLLEKWVDVATSVCLFCFCFVFFAFPLNLLSFVVVAVQSLQGVGAFFFFHFFHFYSYVACSHIFRTWAILNWDKWKYSESWIMSILAVASLTGYSYQSAVCTCFVDFRWWLKRSFLKLITKFSANSWECTLISIKALTLIALIPSKTSANFFN